MPRFTNQITARLCKQWDANPFRHHMAVISYTRPTFQACWKDICIIIITAFVISMIFLTTIFFALSHLKTTGKQIIGTRVKSGTQSSNIKSEKQVNLAEEKLTYRLIMSWNGGETSATWLRTDDRTAAQWSSSFQIPPQALDKKISKYGLITYMQ